MPIDVTPYYPRFPIVTDRTEQSLTFLISNPVLFSIYPEIPSIPSFISPLISVILCVDVFEIYVFKVNVDVKRLIVTTIVAI